MWPFSPVFPEKVPEAIDGHEYDYVVIGGGTAGAVLASKLSQDPSVSVLVLERGPIGDTWMSRVPLISSDYNNEISPVIHGHKSLPVAARGGFRINLMSAHIMGGNSRVNASIATRGIPGGYNDWSENYGLTDWSWDRVEPYFKGLESAPEADGDSSRGRDGPVRIRHVKQAWDFPSYLEKSYGTLGLAGISSVNSSRAPAQNYSEIELAVNDKGERVSSFSAFLNARVATDRKAHLTICTRSAVTKLAISDDGKTVTGVHFRRARQKKGERSGPDCFVKVRREAIICSGALFSPLVLMHSGIGPSDVLAKHDIPCVRELPVGKHFQDHLIFGLTVEVPPSESIHGLQNSVILGLWHFLLYIFLGIGVLSGNPCPTAAFLKTEYLDDKTMEIKTVGDDGQDTSDPSDPRNAPDIEIMTLACTCLDKWSPGKNIISLLPCLTQPKSTGKLEPASKDPEDLAEVTYPYFTDERDLIAARKATRFTMRVLHEFLHNSGYPHQASILTAPSINRLPAEWDTTFTGQSRLSAPFPDSSGRPRTVPTVETQVFLPRSEVEKTWDTVTDEEIDAYILAGSSSGHHSASTCRMSVDPKDGVVDQRLMVHGMTNLRVADTSALPTMPTAHTMLPAMMLGLRCADFIREDWKEGNR